MSNNYWNQPPENNNGNHHDGSPRSGSLIRNYSDQTVQAPSQYSPLTSQSPQGAPPSQYSPLPPVHTPQQEQWPAPQAYPTPGFIGNAVQTVRRWTGKMAAARGGTVDQDPLVLYHPTTSPPVEVPKAKPWKRSHSVRVAMQMRHRRERWKEGHPSGQRIAIVMMTIFVLVLVIILSSGAASGYAYYQSQLPRVQGLANSQIEQSSRIYDRNGNLLYVAYDNKTGRGTPVTYKYIPGVLQDAMVAAEDHTFWDNSGIDPQGILRAATQYSSSGSVQSGGSTITQQVIKNLTHDTQVSLQRKIPEAALAIGLTQQYPKWKILEMYFNISPFGAQELGVDAAAQDYFGLNPKCNQNFECVPAVAFLDQNQKGKPDPILALARASLLAGMPQNPVSFDPILGPDHVKLVLIRQDYVLQQMLALNMHINTALGDQTIDNGPITPDIIHQVEALTDKMAFHPYKYFKKAPHFVDWVTTQIETALGTDPKTGLVNESQGVNLFLTGGFNIRTTIDLKLENYVEQNVRHHLRDREYQIFVGDYGPLNTVHNVNDSAVVVMSAKTGEVLAMDGSADYNDPTRDPRIAGEVNAALALRQPGSSFKPIVYATAFQMGWYPGIVLPDKKTYFPNNTPTGANINTATYHPTDYGGGYHNLNSNIVLDIANSFNIPAIKALEYAGFDNVLTMARRFGITDIDQDVAIYNQQHNSHLTVDQYVSSSMALGTTGVSLLQMVGAYQVFANQGARISPQGILDIWDNYGNHLYKYNPKSTQVISQQIAFLISSILSNNEARAIEFAGDNVLTMQDWDNRPVAAKTGTTDNFQDNWTIGYTPDIVVGVWSGNANGAYMTNNVVGITGAAPIWHDVIEYASGKCDQGCGDIKFAPDQFNPPSGVTQQQVNTVNGLAGSGYLSWMLDTDVPQQSGLMTQSGNGNGNGTPMPTPTP
ncbi:MAG: transglycosylase domain-containing protein [Ktedonobacteraceae bacterium]